MRHNKTRIGITCIPRLFCKPSSFAKIKSKWPLSRGSHFKTQFCLKCRGNRRSSQDFHETPFSKDCPSYFVRSNLCRAPGPFVSRINIREILFWLVIIWCFKFGRRPINVFHTQMFILVLRSFVVFKSRFVLLVASLKLFLYFTVSYLIMSYLIWFRT